MMAYAEAKRLDANRIPVIDITPLRDGSNATDVAQALHAASRDMGFIYIAGHGIPADAIEDARTEAMAFFHASEAEKAQVTVSAKHRGWLRQGGAKMQDDAKPDLKESFIWGYENADGATPDNHALRGPNRWPDSKPALRTVSMRYFQEAHRVAHHLMRGFALGLGLAEGFFLRSAAEPLSRASYVFYPQQDAALGPDQFGVGPHTDFGVLTVLCQDAVGGLQVQDLGGDWIHAPPIDGTLVVNVGDLLARWTGGAYRSTPHRVVNSSGRDRLSLVLAFDPDPDTVIDPRAVGNAGNTDMAEPITCGDYLIWRFKRAFSYR